VYISLLLFLSLLFVVFFLKDPDVATEAEEHEGSVLRELSKSLRSFMHDLYLSFMKSGSGPKVGLIFAVLPVGAMALAYATLTTMQVDYGLAEIQIAEISVYNTIATALGCIIGGALGDRFGLKKMLGTFYLLTTLPTLILALQITNVGLESVSLQLFYGIVISYGLFFGMAFGLRPAIFMGMTNPAVAATQFTAFMGLGNLGISLTNFWQGIVAERFDYATVLYLDSLILIIPLMIMPFVKNREESPELALA